MNNIIDLHTHSTASDGTFSPTQLVQYAAQKKVDTLALTDHDTIDGISEAINEAHKIGLNFVPGVEIGVDFDREMHLLGYFSSKTYTRIEVFLSQLRKHRNERNPKLLHRLNELGISISQEDVIRETDGALISRLHFAKALVRHGVVQNVTQAFEKILGPGKPAFIKKDQVGLEEAIQSIVKAGGVPILAHPIYLNLSSDELEMLLVSRLLPSGLCGLEAYYADNTNEQTGLLLRLCNKYGLIPTGGSDFHGLNRPASEMGVGRGNLSVPQESLEKLLKRIEYHEMLILP